MSDEKISGKDLHLFADELQYSHYTIDCNNGRHEDLTLAYGGNEYDIQIRDGEPVVVQND